MSSHDDPGARPGSGPAAPPAAPPGASGGVGPGPLESAPAGPGPGRARRQYSLTARDRRLGYSLVAAAVIILLLIAGYPLIYNIWNSFHHVNYIEPATLGQFAGVSNYDQIFTDHLFVPSLARTLGFTAVSVVIELVIGMALALALNMKFRGRGLVRAAIFIPWAVPTVVSAQLWKTMFDPQQGFVNYILIHLHLPLGHTAFLAQTWTSWAAILVADAWRNVPFMAILLLAGLQVIPDEIYEAARVDGASALKSFWRLTLPLLKPALMVALVFRTLQSFLIFDVIYAMTGGGPGNSTDVLSYLDWSSMLQDANFGYGGAVSVAIMVMSLIIAVVIVRAFRSEPAL